MRFTHDLHGVSRTGTWLALSGAICLALLSSCASGRRSDVTYHDPNMDFGMIQTIAVMPFANLTADKNAGNRVRDMFMTMLQATGSAYVLPPGEVGRGISRVDIDVPEVPAPEQVVALARNVGADVIITGTVLEYGTVRSGSASANVISVSVEMMEAELGRVVWSGSSTRGGVGAAERLFGSGGQPMNGVTEAAMKDLMNQLFID